MADELQPTDRDLEFSRRLFRTAASMRVARFGGTEERRSAVLEAWLAAPGPSGRLWLVDGEPVGLVQWTVGNPVGPGIDLVAVEPSRATVDLCARLLSRLEQEIGVAAFLYGPILGLTPEQESRLMRGRGFRPFSRSEMMLRDGAHPPSAPAPSGRSFRALRPEDREILGDLHHRAYDRRFDSFLFLELPDRREDAQREVRQLVEGRWGAFVPEGSRVAQRDDGRLVGAVMSVRGADGVLIAQVMVDPTEQGRGVGRALLTESIRGLLGSGTRRIYLNVTEGNLRAVRLYESLGFDRSLGPSQDWYNAARVPVDPNDVGPPPRAMG